MRVHLISDDVKNSRRPKLGLGYISSYIKKYGTNISLSLSFFNEDIIEIIKKKSPEVIGLSSQTITFKKMKEVSSAIKENYPQIPVLMGGVHLSILPEKLPETVDVAILGEGEETLLEWINNYRKSGVVKQRETSGLAFRDNNDKIYLTGQRNLIEPLDRIPSPDWDFLKIDSSGPGYIMTSRGCPFKCRFCYAKLFWGKTRLFSSDYVVDEIQKIYDNYKTEEILIYDDLFTANKNRIFEISNKLCQRGLNKKISFECLARADIFDEDLAWALKRMNMERVGFGMESGSQKILDYLKDNQVKLDHIRKAVKICKRCGLDPLGSFMIGSPYETEEDVYKTMNFIKELGLREVEINVTTAFPGTRLWDFAKEKGLISSDEWDDTMWGFNDINRENIDNKVLLSDIDKNRFLELQEELYKTEEELRKKSTLVREFRKMLKRNLRRLIGKKIVGTFGNAISNPVLYFDKARNRINYWAASIKNILK